MKNLKLYLALTMAFIMSLMSGLHAQEIFTKESTMSLGTQKAFAVDLENADRKLAEKKWKECVKDYGKVKRNKKADEWYTMDTRIPAIGSEGKVDLYLKLEEGRDMTRAVLFVDNGTRFIGEDDEVAEGVERFMREYANEVKRHVITKELEDEEDKLKDVNKQLNKLEKNNKKYHEEIEKARKKIEEMERKIEQNLLDQDAANESRVRQEKSVEEVKDRLNNIGKG